MNFKHKNSKLYELCLYSLNKTIFEFHVVWLFFIRLGWIFCFWFKRYLHELDLNWISRAEEPGNCIAAPAPDFFSKRLRLPNLTFASHPLRGKGKEIKIQKSGKRIQNLKGKREKKKMERKRGKRKKRGKKNETKKKAKNYLNNFTWGTHLKFGEENSAKNFKGEGGRNQTLVRIYSTPVTNIQFTSAFFLSSRSNRSIFFSAPAPDFLLNK